MNLDSLKHILSPLPLASIHFFEEISSTNVYALNLLAEQTICENGTLVIANAQTAGRGRFERKWVTQPGSSLAFTLILSPSAQEAQKNVLFSPLGALSVCMALEKMGLSPEIKWPNDVLLDGKKMCGILAESYWFGQWLKGIVLGIGVNVGLSSIPPTEALLFPATCIEAYSQHPVDRIEFLHEVLRYIFLLREEILEDSFIQAWDKRLAFRGEEVAILQKNSEDIKGVLLGISANGQLRLGITPTKEIEILVGDVKLRPMWRN